MTGESGDAKHFMLDPRAFICPPYRKCPGCHAEASFGVLMICPHHYVRRCRQCWYSEIVPLPDLRKHVLYLDQFAISNMMKALNPNVRPRKHADDGFWHELFVLVDRLCKLQLLICPDSEVHNEESLVSPFPAPLRRMYELLSGGVTLERRHHVEVRQLHEHVQRWAAGRESEAWQFDVSAIAHGDLHAWQSRLIISMNLGTREEWIEELRHSRDVTYDGMAEVFKGWQQEGSNFEFWRSFREEARSYGVTILGEYIRYLRRWQDIQAGKVDLDLVHILPPPAVLTIEAIQDGLVQAGVPRAEAWPQTLQFLASDAVERLPFNRIAAMLYAAIARKAAAGQKRPPSRGMADDVRLISTYLPYLDSMLIDNECHSYLLEQPLREELAYRCQVFSLNTRDELLAHLRAIEARASAVHLATVREVYGDDWGEPYESVYPGPSQPPRPSPAQ